jgi:hypothetical protein
LVSADTPFAGSHPKRKVKLAIELAALSAIPLVAPYSSATSYPFSTPDLEYST